LLSQAEIAEDIKPAAAGRYRLAAAGFCVVSTVGFLSPPARACSPEKAAGTESSAPARIPSPEKAAGTGASTPARIRSSELTTETGD